MNRFSCVSLAVMLSALSGGAGIADESSLGARDAEREVFPALDDLSRQLGSPSFIQRDWASRRLMQQGPDVVPRLVATVRVAHELGDADSQRLQGALARQYDRPVHLNVVVDPDVVGGVKVEIGDDVIDGTVASRLDDARRRLAG